MAKSLVIVESPAKARTIGRYLGGNYIVQASMGHVRDLPQDEFGVDLEHDFTPTYEILPAKKKTVGQLKKAAKGAEEIYLATDLDREGEAIAWHLCAALGVPVERARRVVFNQITQTAVRAAFNQPRALDLNRVNAQQTRRILDRVVGYELSPLLWRLVTKGLSAGRVQSVAVRLVVDREREIAAFVSKEYWEIKATLAPQGHAAEKELQFIAELAEWRGKKFEAATGAEADAVVKALEGAPYTVAALRKDARSEWPPPPFITSTLQQTAASQLRMSTKKTMVIAQQLYEGVAVGGEGEHGLITYMRTDSVNIAPEAIAACRDLVQREYGDAYLPKDPRRYKSRAGAQEAHEAIRPTDVARTPQSLVNDLDRDQLRVYELIWKRFVASQMEAARYENTNARITAGEGMFVAKGRRLLFDGFRRVAGLASTEDQLLPALAEGQALDLVNLDPSQHFTEPPPRYSEATLVRALEREGIGRPSTYAPIVATIQDRGYVKLIQRRFHATELGMKVTDLLVKHFERIMDVGFTRFMESELDRIAEQGAEWVTVLRKFYEPFRQALEAAGELTGDRKCPKCGKPLTVKRGRFGSYIACTGAPECDHKQRINGQAEAETIDEKCPQCGKPLAVKWSKWGKFFGCTGYPECKFTKRPGGEESTPMLDEKCPDCGKPLGIKRSRFGPFVGCTGYPACKFTRRLPRGRQSASAGAGAEDASAAAPASPADAEAADAQSAAADPDGRHAQARAIFDAAVKSAKAHAPAQAGAPADSDEATPEENVPPCEKCGAPMVLRRSRRGPFYGCSAYPKCKNLRPTKRAAIPEEYAQAAEGKTCPDCGSPMVVRHSRHGYFLGCSKYPKCKGTQPLEGRTPGPAGADAATGAADPVAKAEPRPRKKREPKKTGVPCPRPNCGGGLVERRGPSGKFFGCSNFPTCTYTTQELPEEGKSDE